MPERGGSLLFQLPTITLHSSRAASSIIASQASGVFSEHCFRGVLWPPIG